MYNFASAQTTRPHPSPLPLPLPLRGRMSYRAPSGRGGREPMGTSPILNSRERSTDSNTDALTTTRTKRNPSQKKGGELFSAISKSTKPPFAKKICLPTLQYAPHLVVPNEARHRHPRQPRLVKPGFQKQDSASTFNARSFFSR